MKKTILTIMVAAMMLVAFTACEQAQMPTYKNADYLTIVQNTAFIEGQAFNANNFEVVVHYTYGSTSTIPGAGVVTGTWATGAAKGSTVSAKLTDALKVDSFAVNVIDQDDCELTVVLAEDTTSPIKKDASSIDKRAVEVKIESISYTAEGITYKLDSVAGYGAVVTLTAKELKVAGSYELEATIYSGYTSTSSVGTKIGTAMATVEVTDSTKDTAIASMKVVVVDTEASVADEEPVAIANPYIDDTTIKVLGYNKAGEFVKELAATADYKVIGDAFPSTALPLADDPAVGTVYLVADNSIYAPYSISGQDFIDEISLEKANVTVKPGETFSIASVGKVTGKYASSDTKTADVTSKCSAPKIAIPETAANASTLSTTVTYINEKGEKVPATVTITVSNT